MTTGRECQCERCEVTLIDITSLLDAAHAAWNLKYAADLAKLTGFLVHVFEARYIDEAIDDILRFVRIKKL